MKRPSRAALAALVLTAACGPTQQPPSRSTSQETGPRDAASALAPPGSASALAGAASGVAAVPASPATEATVELPFVQVGAVPLELGAIDGTLVGWTSYSERPDGMSRTFKLFLLRGDRFEVIWRHERNQFNWQGPDAVYGAQEGPIDVVGYKPGARVSDPVIDTLLGPKAGHGGFGSWMGIASRDGATYGVSRRFGSSGMTTLRGKPTLAQRPAPAGCHGDWGEYSQVIADTLVVTRGGDLIAAGTACGESFALEVWKSGSTTSEIIPVQPLPTDPKGEPSFGAVPRGDGFLLTPSLRRWDGSKLVPITPQPPGKASRALDLPDGRLLVVSNVTRDKSTLRRVYVKDGDTWKRAVIRGGGDLLDVFSDGKNVWAYGDAPGAPLYKLAPAGAAERLTWDPKEIPDEATLEKNAADRAAGKRPRFLPGGPGCDSNVVVLYGFTKVTPDDYDFPLTRKAVKGHTELAGVTFAVTEDGGDKFFVGITPSFSVAKKLRDLIEKQVQGSKPQVVCAGPPISRVLDIDLSTGELRKEAGGP